MATTLNIPRGTTYTLEVVYKRYGVPASLVGATVRFTMKDVQYDASTDDSTADIKKDVTNGDENGNAVITILPADTSTVVPSSYYYDVKVQNADDTIYTLDEGKIKLTGSPTNRIS